MIRRFLPLCTICGLLAAVLVSSGFPVYAQNDDSSVRQTEQEHADSAERAVDGEDQTALEAEIDAVEKVLETGDTNDAEGALSEYEADKPLPADAALSLPSDI